MVLFPLLLIGLDEFMDHNTKGVFALAVFLNAMVNYFFFFGEVLPSGNRNVELYNIHTHTRVCA